MQKIHAIMGNSQLLDGGAMFGNAPKALWARWVDVDEINRVPLCCRAMLVQDGTRNILLETGIGVFFDPKLKQRYGVVEDEHVLLKSLQDQGLSHEQIDIVVLSHLHFDHAGGLLTPWQEAQAPQLLFPNAKFVVGRQALERAWQPHFRDRASFIPELIPLFEQSGRLSIVDGERSELLGDDFRFHYSDGHTPGLMMTEVTTTEGPVIFASDLIPGTPWVHLPITMGYDRYPELLIEEKQRLLDDVIQREGQIFYTHDPQIALSHIGKNKKGQYIAIDGLATI